MRTMPFAMLLVLLCACSAAGRGRGRERPGTLDAGPARDAGSAPTGRDSGRPPVCDGCDAGPARSCTGVDLLFVIDNSTSMGDEQEKLATVFPAFVDAMFDRLPYGTDLHVGITTSDFYDGTGGSPGDDGCESAEDPAYFEDFYVRPSERVTVEGGVAENGGQGRLYEWSGGRWFAANTAGDRAGLKTWFTAAATSVGEGGSVWEMPIAGAGWAVHPANGEANAGFLRDEETVLVIFFLTDEPDQSPEPLAVYREMILGAKAGCGGDACVITAGLIDGSCSDWSRSRLHEFLGSFGEEPLWGDIEGPVESFTEVVGDSLAGVIDQTCDEILLF